MTLGVEGQASGTEGSCCIFGSRSDSGHVSNHRHGQLKRGYMEVFIKANDKVSNVVRVSS